MKDLKGTKTEQNLLEAFAGESQARNKYSYFASKARKDGYEQIAAIFEETANNEKEHAKLWYKLLNGGEISDTMTNLREAAEGENYEWSSMYDRMAREAEEEGFPRNRVPLPCRGSHRAPPRRTLPPPARQHRGWHRFLARRRHSVDMPQLRTHRHRQESPQSMPGMQSPRKFLRNRS